MNKLSIAKQIPFSILIKRIIKRIVPAKKINYTAKEYRTTFSSLKLLSLLDNTEFESISNKKAINHYLNHEFNLLGSAWLNRDLKNTLNLNPVHELFYNQIKPLISVDYQLINWQLDIKSGFEFDVAKQFNQQKLDKTKNIDIKNCWELGRLQHLPQLAFATVGTANKEKLILEFKNQCLDFIASNPIGMGVQWACTMDVGIRVCNLLLAYDIFNEFDEADILNEEFNQIFIASIYQHGLFIFNHLEYKEGAAGNHYLFNLIGLLFVTNYLSETEETKSWKAFAEYEIENEFYKQFFADGGNFEGSTTYHCLSAEAMLYATALLLRNGKKLGKKYIDLLGKSAYFIKCVMKPNGEIPQLGDNDSGRLFTFCHTNFDSYQNDAESNKIFLDYKSLLAGFSGLFKGNDFACFAEKNPNHRLIIEQIAKNYKLEIRELQTPSSNLQVSISNLQHSEQTKINFPSTIKTEEINYFSFPDFGITIFKSEQFYLAISTISNPKMHHSWGHVHNDKLSFELQVNGVDLVKDAGTYTYSTFPKIRDEFRSTNAHHGIIVESVEQNKLIDLFYLEREIECQIFEKQDLSITLKAKYYGVKHIRKFEILANQLIISDYCNKAFKVNINKFDKYAPSYGALQKVK